MSYICLFFKSLNISPPAHLKRRVPQFLLVIFLCGVSLVLVVLFGSDGMMDSECNSGCQCSNEEVLCIVVPI